MRQGVFPVKENGKRGFWYELKKNKILFIMLIPATVFFVVNNYIPIVGIYYAFTKYSFTGGLFGSKFVGMDNFAFLFRSNTLFTITKNTILYNLVFIFLGNILEIIVAVFLSRLVGNAFRKITQTLIFLPYFVSFVILNVLVYNLFNYEFGFINTLLKTLQMPVVDFYNTPGLWPFLITAFYLWKWVGYGTVIYLATILGISEDYYEASEIDGATTFQQIRYITLPLLKPTFIILLLFAIGSIMHGQFELFYQMVGNNGNLFSTTDIIDTYVYRTLVDNFDINMGTAAGLYQSVFGFIIIMVTNYLIKRRNPDYALF